MPSLISFQQHPQRTTLVPGENILHLPAPAVREDVPGPIQAFQDLLPPPSPTLPSLAAPPSHNAKNHEEERDNDKKDEQETPYQGFGYNPPLIPHQSVTSMDHNHNLVSVDPAFSETSSLHQHLNIGPNEEVVSAPTNVPNHPPTENGNRASTHPSPPPENTNLPRLADPAEPRRENEARDTIADHPSLTLDSLARFIAQQFWDPQAHIPAHTTPVEPLILQEHVLSVEEALEYDELQIPDVLRDSPFASDNTFSLEDLSPDERQKLYCGFNSDEGPDERLAISIQKDALPTKTGVVTYDFDSYNACLTTLGAARQGINCITVQKPTPPLASNIHLGTFSAYLHPTSGPDNLKQVKLPLQEIPHISLGRLIGHDKFEIFIFFPHALREEQQTTTLPQRWYDIWLDEIFLPAYYEIYDANSAQAYPASAADARGRATKRYTEDMRRGGHPQPRQQLLALELHPRHLDPFYARVLEKIALPGHHMFADPILLLGAKGLKLGYRSTRWTTMYADFFGMLDNIVDRRQTQWAFYDCAKEFCPSRSSIAHSRHDGPGEVLLWDQRYLQTFYTALRSLDPSRKHRVEFYPHYFLKGPAGATMEPAQTSPLWQHGLRYVQSYNSAKNLFCAGDFYAGTNAAMADLAVDHSLLRTFQVLGKGIAVDPQTLLRGYLHMKEHTWVTLTDSCEVSRGLREEIRGSEELIQAIHLYMQEQETLADQLGEPPPEPVPPEAFFTLKSRVFARWLLWNLGRLCFGFESIYAISAGRSVSWEQSRMMMMFLRCIPCLLGHGVAGSHARFWYDQYPPQKNVVAGEGPQGFGFSDTMDRYGFAWFADKIDWVTLTFDWRFAPYLGFSASHSERRFKHRQSIQTFKDHIIRIQHTQPYFAQWGQDPNCYTFLARYLHQICAHVFRVDVFTHIKKTLAEDWLDDALAGEVPLCYEAVSAALDPDQGIKMQIAHAAQNKLRMWRDLWKALWGADRDTPAAFRDKPYRRVYHQSLEVIQAALGPRQAAAWSKQFQTFIRSTCWIMPYPSNGRLIYVVGKIYKWWSSCPSQLQQYLAEEASGQLSAQNQALCIQDLQWKTICSPRKSLFHSGSGTMVDMIANSAV